MRRLCWHHIEANARRKDLHAPHCCRDSLLMSQVQTAPLCPSYVPIRIPLSDDHKHGCRFCAVVQIVVSERYRLVRSKCSRKRRLSPHLGATNDQISFPIIPADRGGNDRSTAACFTAAVPHMPLERRDHSLDLGERALMPLQEVRPHSCDRPRNEVCCPTLKKLWCWFVTGSGDDDERERFLPNLDWKHFLHTF